ncbi:hypothetical protein HDU98_003417 [Podochytrium sp. JEL0797]|nr:hypothetical protein HDU98_003417 [Podochytrium sp. JEL0797]
MSRNHKPSNEIGKALDKISALSKGQQWNQMLDSSLRLLVSLLQNGNPSTETNLESKTSVLFGSVLESLVQVDWSILPEASRSLMKDLESLPTNQDPVLRAGILVVSAIPYQQDSFEKMHNAMALFNSNRQRLEAEGVSQVLNHAFDKLLRYLLKQLCGLGERAIREDQADLGEMVLLTADEIRRVVVNTFPFVPGVPGLNFYKHYLLYTFSIVVDKVLEKMDIGFLEVIEGDKSETAFIRAIASLLLYKAKNSLGESVSWRLFRATTVFEEMANTTTDSWDSDDIRKFAREWKAICDPNITAIVTRFQEYKSGVYRPLECPTEDSLDPFVSRIKKERALFPVGFCCSGCHEARSVSVKLKRCGACEDEMYCSVGCQKKAWKAGHKRYCRARGVFEKGDFVMVYGQDVVKNVNCQLFFVDRFDAGRGEWAVVRDCLDCRKWDHRHFAGKGNMRLLISAEEMRDLRRGRV